MVLKKFPSRVSCNKILVVNHVSTYNKGDEAIMKVLIRGLKRVAPQAELTVLSSSPSYDSAVLDVRTHGDIQHVNKRFPALVYAFLIITWALFRRYTSLNLDRIFSSEAQIVLNEYAESSIIVSRGGDFFNDTYGLKPLVSQCFVVFLAILLGKRVMLCAHSFGPFRKTLFIKITGAILNKSSLITTRGKVSIAWLNQMKVNRPPIYQCADLAFLLKPASNEKINQILTRENIPIGEKPLVGLSVNKWLQYSIQKNRSTAEQRYQELISLMRHIVDYLTVNLGTFVVIVPHVFDFPFDDRDIARDIIKEVKMKSCVHLIEGEYSAEEIKGVISNLDMFIGCRMHAVIASTSTFVPTIAISYMDKFRDIMGILDQEQWVCDASKINYTDIESKINEMWSNRAAVRNCLKQKTRVARRFAKRNFFLLKKIVD